MRLIIDGNLKQLKIIEKQQRSRAKKYRLKMEIEDNVNDVSELTAAEIIEFIKIAETEDDLIPFADDSRKIVKKAYKIRLKELGL